MLVEAGLCNFAEEFARVFSWIQPEKLKLSLDSLPMKEVTKVEEESCHVGNNDGRSLQASLQNPSPKSIIINVNNDSG